MGRLRSVIAKLAVWRRRWNRRLRVALRPRPALEAHAERFTHVVGFGSNPGRLRMISYVPHHLPPSSPLVVALHGCAQNAAMYDYGTGWSALADRYQFALLLPEQQQSNNYHLCFNWFRPEDARRNSGESLSIREMIEWMLAAHRLGRSRVFICGLSAGAAMAGIMLATQPEVFAAGALIAGVPYGCASTTHDAFECMFKGKHRSSAAWGDLVRQAAPGYRGPWPRVSIWHGDSDRTVVPSNASELVKQWADVHRLGPPERNEELVDGSVRTVWRDARGNIPLEQYTVRGMAHGVPLGGISDEEEYGNPGDFMLDVGISSTVRIAKFWGLIGDAPTARDALEYAQRPLPGVRSGPTGPLHSARQRASDALAAALRWIT